MAAFDQLVATFNQTVGQRQGIQVETISKSSAEELASQVLSAAHSNTALPEILLTDTNTAGQLVKMNKLVKLNQYMTAAQLAEFHQDFLAGGYSMNHTDLYLLPLAKACDVIALNMTDWKVFAAKNPKYTDVVQIFSHWESIGRAADAYYRWSGGQALFGMDSLENFLTAGNRQLGIDLLQSGTTADGHVELNREVMNQLWRIYYINTVKGGFAIQSELPEDLQDGTLAAAAFSAVSGADLPVNVWKKDGSPEEIDLQILPYPIFQDADPVCIQDGLEMAVTSSTPPTETAAMIFLGWLVRPEQNVDFAISAGCLPVTQAALQSQLMRNEMAETASANLQRPGVSRCLSVMFSQVNSYQFYSPDTFAGSQEISSFLADSLRDAASQARQSWLGDIKKGLDPEKLQDLYFNDAAFEEWYSQLVIQVGRLMDQN